jgi:chromosome condensin MukBEF complex kleisin-like MukF subunit
MLLAPADDAVELALQVEHQPVDKMEIVARHGRILNLWIGYDRHVHKFIRTAIDMDKNRVFAQRLRQSVLACWPQLTMRSSLLCRSNTSRSTKWRSSRAMVESRHVHKFIRTAIDMDKNRVFAQRLRQSVQTYFDELQIRGPPAARR